MRIRPALVAAPLLLLSFVALAQPKRAAKEPEDRASAKADKADKADKPDPKAEPPPAPGPSTGGDWGGPPTKGAGSSESKLSPLTPEANEFPDGGSQAPP